MERSRLYTAVAGLADLEQVIISRLNRHLEPTGLTFHDIRLLDHLSGADNYALLTSEISRKMGVQKSVTTHRVKNLERKGAIVRKPLESDGRKTLVILTAKGRRALDLAITIANAALEPIGHILGDTLTTPLAESQPVAKAIFEMG